MKLVTKRTMVFFFLFLTILQISFAQGTNEDYLRYIEKFRDTATSEMNRTGIPASITLAQGLLESNAGKSSLARKAKNHFGIKCGPAWRGKKFHLEDDDFDEYGNKIKSCFRVYKNATSSYIAHSEFLRDPRKSYRYGPLFTLDPLDYQGWAFGLKESGYASDPRYPQKLIKLVEDYNLNQYDLLGGDPIVIIDSNGDSPTTSTNKESTYGHLGKINDLKVFVAKGGESVYQVAFRNNVKLKRIIKYNAGVTSGENKLPQGYKLYLQSKRWGWRGKALFHYVQDGETLFDISQKYGIKINKLRRKNKIPDNADPLVGERIRLRWWHKRNEVVKYKTTSQPIPMLRNVESENPKEATPKKKENGDLLDMEVSPSDEKYEEVLIEVDPALTENQPEETEIKESEEIDININELPSTETTVPTTTTETPVVIDNTPVETTIPTTTTPVETTPTTTTTSGTVTASTTYIPPTQPEERYITIIKGDTLYGLSRSFKVSVTRLKDLNGLSSNALSIGQRIRVQ